MFGTDRSTTTSPDKARSLRGVRILNDLEPRELALLAAECDWRSYARNDIIFSAGQGGTRGDVVFVVAGSVRLARPTGPNGRIAYVDVNAGGQFGETGILGLDDSDLAAIAREDTLIALLPEARFSELLARQESVSRALLFQYAKLLRAREAASEAASGSQPGATGVQRVYAELLALAEPQAPGGAAGEAHGGLFVARLPRHRELADRLSTTEEVVAGAIAELVRLEIAERDYPGLRIRNEAALRRICDSR